MWYDRNVSLENFVLTLGESQLGPVTVDLRTNAHILLGGVTGSGKTVLLKVLLRQAIDKGARVYIADFKGGVDFKNYLKALDEIGYHGFLTIEREVGDDPEGDIRLAVDFLNGLINYTA